MVFALRECLAACVWYGVARFVEFYWTLRCVDSCTRRVVDACKNDCVRATVDVWRRTLHYEFSRPWRSLRRNVLVTGEKHVIVVVAKRVSEKGLVGVFFTLVRRVCWLSSRRRRRLAGRVALGQMMLATVKNCLSFVLGVCPDVVLWGLLDGVEYVVGVVYRSQGA